MANVYEIISRFDPDFPRKRVGQLLRYLRIHEHHLRRCWFLFGSVTTKVTHLAKDCTVWVVQ